jgi:tRNA pseudouridine55 synthase
MLIVAIGEATKLSDYAMSGEKVYEFTIKFGASTDTFDPEGKIIETSDKLPSQAQIEASFKQFLGGYSQKPPSYSAIKVDGVRSYQLARAGIELDLKPRDVMLYDCNLINYENDEARLQIRVGKGFYVRSFMRDICEVLGVCGHVSTLRRLGNGIFQANDMIMLEKVEKVVHNAKCENWEQLIKSIDTVLDDILVLDCDEQEARLLKNGVPINSKETYSLETCFIKCFGKLIAIASLENCLIKPKRIFNL